MTHDTFADNHWPADVIQENLRQRLQPFNQQHLLAFWEQLSESQQRRLAHQIQKIDFQLMQQLSGDVFQQQDWADLATRAESPEAITLADFADAESYQQAVFQGSEVLRGGKVAMILVAGGQGSRLGFEAPKGIYPIGPLSHRSLFQMFIDHVAARGQQFGKPIPLFIMTSPATDEQTRAHFHENGYLGMDPQQIHFFCQGSMPALDDEGKLILEHPDQIFLSPDGHGGMLAALQHSGGLQKLVEMGIEQIFYAQVDNPLVQVCHPALIGYHILRHSEMTTQVVRKQDPLQKVGNVVVVDGVNQVIEYSDLPEPQARLTNPDGSLKLWAGSIAVHLFETQFLVRCSDQADSLPFHQARKKVACIDASGSRIEPDSPNAIKFEKFIFDLLPLAKRGIVLEVDPAEGFCAVKNAPPAASETPDHVKQAISDLHRRWLIQAGAIVEENVRIEINPKFAIDADELATKIQSGCLIDKDTYFH